MTEYRSKYKVGHMKKCMDSVFKICGDKEIILNAILNIYKCTVVFQASLFQTKDVFFVNIFEISGQSEWA